MKRLFSYLSVLLLSTACMAQSYTFSVFTEAYQPLNELDSIKRIAGGANADAWPWFAKKLRIEFDFPFIEVDMDTIVACAKNFYWCHDAYCWGFMGLYNDAFYFIDRNYVFGAPDQGPSWSDAWYHTVGDTGNRIFRFEYHNVKMNTSNENDSINFQVWFYEKDSAIEYRYGPGGIETPDSILFPDPEWPGFEVGFGLADVDSNNTVLWSDRYYLQGDPSSPQMIYTQEPGGENPYLDGLPPDGTVYRFVPDPVGISQPGNLTFSVYPNPVRDVIYVKTGDSEEATASLFDLEGRLLREEPISGFGKLDISALPQGIYLLKIRNEQGIGFKKVVKQ